MTRHEFEQLIEEEFPNAVPAKFHHLLKNVAFVVEERAPGGDLLGLYQGVSLVERGEGYGMGPTMPDTITLYQHTIEDEALRHGGDMRKVVRETLWHEVAHYLGYDEDQVQERERRSI